MADQQALHAFAQWVASCSGNEKQKGQTFGQKLLTAWGWADATEAGVSFEHKIPKGGAGGGMGYADALIPGKVLIEMKQRGEKLATHFGRLQLPLHAKPRVPPWIVIDSASWRPRSTARKQAGE